MTLKEADRFAVLKRVESKNLKLKQAARELSISYRQIKRIWKRYQQKGAEGLVSLRRGKPSPHQLSPGLREKALQIIREQYSDYGPTLIAEKLKEKHHLILSKETIRLLMMRVQLWKGKKRKEIKIHPRRTRRSRIGELIQIDGSYEYWFEDRGEKCCLIVFVDDATSQILLMRFCEHETLESYLKLLKLYLKRYGRPLAFYSDKHAIFRVNRKEIYKERKRVTKFHEVLKRLDIELICAHSPQAKGRVERAHETLQDRLIKELRERKISSMEEGNQFLDEFTQFYNRKFGKEPALNENAHRALLPSQNLEHLLMERSERIVSKDLSFHYKNEIYQLDPHQVRSMHRQKVEVLEAEGEVKVVLKDGRPLRYKKWKEQAVLSIDVKELEVYWPTRVPKKPGKHHPWR